MMMKGASKHITTQWTVSLTNWKVLESWQPVGKNKLLDVSSHLDLSS